MAQWLITVTALLGPTFNSQHLCSNSQLCVMSVPEDTEALLWPPQALHEQVCRQKQAVFF